MNNNFFKAFSERSFLFMWIAEIFTQISVNLFNFYLILVVYSLTKSNTAVAAAIISFTLPAILFGVLAGVYVDHWNKKTVLLLTNIIRAFFFFVLAFMHTNLIAIFAISFIISLVTQFFIPAETPMIPQIVKPNHLLSANALFGLGIYGSILIAYMVSGPIIVYLGQVNTLIILGMCMLIAAIFVSFIPQVKNGKHSPISLGGSELAVKRDIKHALALMVKTKEIYHSLFLLALSQILILIIAAITPGYANQVLHMDLEKFPIVFVTPAAFGMVMGAVFLVNAFHHFAKEKIVTIGLFLSGVAMFILPYASVIASKDVVQTLNRYIPHILDITGSHILFVIAFLLGFANALVFVPSNTILQEKTTDEFRGKIYGVLNALVGLFSLIPIILVGGLSDLFGVGSVIIGIGVVLVGLGLLRVVTK